MFFVTVRQQMLGIFDTSNRLLYMNQLPEITKLKKEQTVWPSECVWTCLPLWSGDFGPNLLEIFDQWPKVSSDCINFYWLVRFFFLVSIVEEASTLVAVLFIVVVLFFCHLVRWKHAILSIYKSKPNSFECTFKLNQIITKYCYDNVLCFGTTGRHSQQPTEHMF